MSRTLLIALFISSTTTWINAMDEKQSSCLQEQLISSMKTALEECNQNLQKISAQQTAPDLKKIQSLCDTMPAKLAELHNEVHKILPSYITHIINRDGASSLLFTLPLALWAYADHRIDIICTQKKEAVNNETEKQKSTWLESALFNGIRRSAQRTAWALLCNSLTPSIGIQPANGWGYMLIYAYLEYLSQPLLTHKPTIKKSPFLAYCADHPKVIWTCKAIIAYIVSRTAL